MFWTKNKIEELPKVYAKRTKKISMEIEKFNVKQTQVEIELESGILFYKIIAGNCSQPWSAGNDENSYQKMINPYVGEVDIIESIVNARNYITFLGDAVYNITDNDSAVNEIIIGKVNRAKILQTTDHLIDYAVAKVVDIL